jgi:hypothetical protein
VPFLPPCRSSRSLPSSRVKFARIVDCRALFVRPIRHNNPSL